MTCSIETKKENCRTATIKLKMLWCFVLCVTGCYFHPLYILCVCRIYTDTYSQSCIFTYIYTHVPVYSVIQPAACHMFTCSLSTTRLNATKTSSEVFSTSPFPHSLLPVSSLAHDKMLGGCLQPIMFSVEQLNCFITATLKALES